MVKFLKKIWHRIRYGKLTVEKLVPSLKGVDKDDLYKGIEPGDIITAAMNLPLDVLADIPADHRVRPYIVARKDNGKLFGYCGTSSFDAKKSKSKIYYLSSKKYNVWKNGYIKLNKSYFIPKDHLLEKNDTLNPRDIDRINMMIQKQRDPKCPAIDVYTGIKNGDVISKGESMYYVYSIETDESLLYTLLKQKSAIPVEFKGLMRYINPGVPKKAKNLNGYTVIGYLPITVKRKIDHYLDSK